MRRHHPLFAWILLALTLLLLLLVAVALVRDQWRLEMELQISASERELNLLASVIRNDLQHGNYQHIGELLYTWGVNNPDIESLRLTSANGFTLSEYSRTGASRHPKSFTTAINYSFRGEARLEITKDFDEIHQRRNQLTWQVASIYTVVALLLSALTHALLKYLRKSEALQEEVARRREAESALENERDRLEESVRARTAQLTATNSELEAFCYSVSHDLRAPLRAIDGFSLALLEDYGNRLDGSGHDYLRRVRHGAQRMGMLIDDLLQLSRVTRGELQLKETDLSNMATEIIAELRQAEPQRTVEAAITPGLKALCDPALLHVLLTNLLNNAWKFSREVPRATIEFGTVTDQNGTAYFIRDNGAGFDMRYAGKLFAAFQRLHRADQFEGTGIGLATVQRIVTKHGGRIWAEAAVGEGATFYFTLPEMAAVADSAVCATAPPIRMDET